MLKKYYPSGYADSVFEIDFQKLYDMGYRGVLLDVDNTLVHHGDDSNARVDELFRTIHRTGLKTLLLSDNSPERLERFIANIDTVYISDAQKPEQKSYLRALEMLGVSRQEAICIGDQMFKDILGANRSGIDSILVHFIRTGNSGWIGFRRYLEKLILVFYRLGKRHQKLGDFLKERER